MTVLKVAIQKSGRLSEKSLALITDSGIKMSNSDRKLISAASNFPVEVLYLRDDDIPQYVEDGVADVGIVGENVVAEKSKDIKIIERLGFSRCRMSLAIPKSVDYRDISWFIGKRIATSYPVILQKFLKDKHIQAEIHEISGSVEIAPGIGLADAIFDIVSSGSTLISNGLREVEVVLRSEAVVIGGNNLPSDKMKILEELLFRFKALQEAKNNKYILLNAPNDKLNDIIAVLPGMKSPTIMPLAMDGWSSLHSVVNEEDFWEVIGKLKELGAQGILVIPIEKMIV
ncbi:MAG: ATP phosphoribosyltransferase [Bacteroidales bacterium]|nr:ATP phosphoribosyltransferase [Bacteroidales bacterium]